MGTAEIRLRFVVTRQGLPDLPAVANIARVLGASLTVAGLVADTPEHVRTLAGRMARLDAVRGVLEAASATVLAMGAEVVDLPLCAVPSALRLQARSRRPRDRPLVGYETPVVCSRCRSQDECLGVPRPYLEDFGEAGLDPL